MPRRSASGSSICTRSSTSHSVQARSRTSANGSRPAATRSSAAGSAHTSTSLPTSRPRRAPLPGVGAGVDGLQLDVRVLHRPGRPWPRAEPAPGRDRRRGRAARRERRPRDHAAGPERELVGARSRTRAPHRVRRAPTRVRCRSGHRANPLHEPASEGLSRAGDQRDAECASVCEHVHLPAQSGSSRILKSMRRTYDRDRYLRLVDRLGSAIPDLALGTDLIVGFPGETDDDFAQTVSLVEEVRFDSAFTFIFSPRSGTAAAELPDQVPDDVKHARLEELVEVVQRVGADRNAARVGRVEQVLVEGPSRTDPALSRGRTRRNTTVELRRRRVGRGARGRPRRGSTSTTLRGRVASLVAAA